MAFVKKTRTEMAAEACNPEQPLINNEAVNAVYSVLMKASEDPRDWREILDSIDSKLRDEMEDFITVKKNQLAEAINARDSYNRVEDVSITEGSSCSTEASYPW